MREDSSTTSFSENEDAFLEGLKSDDCRSILPNYFTKIQEKIEELFVMVRKNNETQIKGKKQLEGLTDSVRFMSSKFDKYEKERLERKAKIVELEGKVVSLSTKVEKLKYSTDRIKQYSRRNSIWIYSLPKVKGKDADSWVIETVKEKIWLDTSCADVDGTHRIGATPKKSDKVRPVIVKFVRCNDRRKTYINKKLLKQGTKVFIAESLTLHRVAKLKETKEKFGFQNNWSNDGRIIYKDNGDDKTKYILIDTVALFYG